MLDIANLEKLLQTNRRQRAIEKMVSGNVRESQVEMTGDTLVLQRNEKNVKLGVKEGVEGLPLAY